VLIYLLAWDLRCKLITGIRTEDACDIDGTKFLHIKHDEVPPGSASVPAKANYYGNEYLTGTLAASLATFASISGECLDEKAECLGGRDSPQRPKVGTPTGLDSIRPVTACFM
jgi:hypothetical protein